MDAIQEKFPEDKDAVTSTAIFFLEKHVPKYINVTQTQFINEKGKATITLTGGVQLTVEGEKALLDYEYKKQVDISKNRKDTFLKVLPIVISGLSFLLSCYAIFVASR